MAQDDDVSDEKISELLKEQREFEYKENYSKEESIELTKKQKLIKNFTKWGIVLGIVLLIVLLSYFLLF